MARALGPCTATMARSRRGAITTSKPSAAATRCIQAMSLSAVPALTTTRHWSGAK
ncbi:Uncharacterised protein [Bordetella pertussis]|nr:Uncharacterised protein [Bordetella pertussis]